MALRTDYFDECWGYQGWLGHHQTDGEHGLFKVWALTAKKVELVVYESADNQAPVYKIFHAKRDRYSSRP